jgi:hypothetical protein
MKIKVLREFVTGTEKYPAGQSIDLPDEIAERVIKVGWAESSPHEWPRHVGGGFYELSNGERVKGKDSAIEVQAALNNE